MTEERKFIFDSRTLITGPFVPCPSCERPDFGVLSITGDSYTRRCRTCLHRGHFELPALRKRIILLDQFAVSNLAFSTRPDLPEHKRLSPQYHELFKLLDQLVQVQLVVCPQPHIHHNESATSKHYEAISRTTEHLSNGCTFWHASEVRRFQLITHCWNWVQGRANEVPAFDSQDFVHGRLHEWSDRILISVERELTAEAVDEIRVTRDHVNQGLRRIFTRWQRERLSFDERVGEELASFGPAMLEQYLAYYRARQSGELEAAPLLPELLFPPEAVVLVNSMCRYLQDRGLRPAEALNAVQRYLCSDALVYVLPLRISSMLWAATARKAASGQRRLPSQGMTNDIEMASSLLPYVDAALLDNEMRGLLLEEPLRSDSDFTARIFSPKSMDDFLTYLRQLYSAAPEPHLSLVGLVYGDYGRREHS